MAPDGATTVCARSNLDPYRHGKSVLVIELVEVDVDFLHLVVTDPDIGDELAIAELADGPLSCLPTEEAPECFRAMPAATVPRPARTA